MADTRDDQAHFSADEFLALARVALTAKGNDVSLFLQRAARRYREKAPEVSHTLVALLRDHTSGTSAARRADASPVDLDTRLQLLRYDPIQRGAEPLLSADTRRELDQIIAEREAAVRLVAAGLHPTRSMLFVGPPGVGKTMSAKWLASRLGIPLFILDLSAVMSSFLGKTGGNIRAVFEHAKSQDCVLLLDELDAVAKRRDDVTEIGELKRLVTVILQELDGWPSDRLLIAATNHSDLLDPAVWRRFDVIVRFEKPNEALVRRALNLFVDGSDISMWENALTSFFLGQSFSDIERFAMKVRRRAALTGRSVQEEICESIDIFGKSPDKKGKIELAASLLRSGVSQRKVSEITGISRVTLRKNSLKEA